jgi:hypothetical protein
MRKIAPIVLFVYARPDHTRRTLEALAANRFASESALFIYADGARYKDETGRVDAVRALARSATGFHSCTVIERSTNYGLAKNIIEGVTEMCDHYDRVIVLEDDIVTSPSFLAYMNEALERFAEDERVASIHGYVYPVRQSLPKAFFLRGADCWGWATWSRAWKHFNPDGRYLLDELKRQKLITEFDFNGAYPFSSQLASQVMGQNDSWAIRWHASAFLAGMLTLYPGGSLVQNIGVDGSGTHCDTSKWYEIALCQDFPNLDCIDVSPSEKARIAFEAFFLHYQGPWLIRLLRRFKRLLSRMIPLDSMHSS